MSHQRIVILEGFLSSEPLMGVDELYIRLRGQYPTLGKATVYRTLKLLEECGIARAIVAYDAPIHYNMLQIPDCDSSFSSANHLMSS